MLSQQFITLYTIFISKYINTGDKLLDSSIISIFGIFITFIMTYLMNEWRKFYNCIIFYLYSKYNNPLYNMDVPYLFDPNKYENYNEFIEKNINQKYITCIDINCRNFTTYIRAFNDFISKMNFMPIRNRFDKSFIYNPSISGYNPSISGSLNKIYEIAIGKYGDIIYIRYTNELICVNSRRFDDIEFIYPFIIKELNNIILSYESEPSDDIYVIIDKNNIISLNSIGKISKKKTFDTLYYEQKDELIKIIEKFKNGKLYPSHIPIDNKLGILLYGPPGTGKTGTISAIANMLNRSILVINFTNVKTCKQLDEILKSSYYDKYVIVFDEFDCILDVISGRNKESKEYLNIDYSQMLLYADGEERKNIIETMKQSRGYKPDANIDLAYLLQKLDGLESSDNRIIIATTNNPDNINPSLLRPGRFDIKICLSYCTSKIAKDILLNYYKDDEIIKSKIIDYLKTRSIKDNTFTPLQIVNMAIQTDYDSLETNLLNKIC
jgi:hypothetical protein